MAFVYLIIVSTFFTVITTVNGNYSYLAYLYTQSYINQYNVTATLYPSDIVKPEFERSEPTTNGYPTSTDLTQILNLFKSENCFAVVSNHRNINLKTQYLPIVTRIPEAALLRIDEYKNGIYYRRGTRQNLLVPFGFENITNKSINWKGKSTTCKLSKYLNNPLWGDSAGDFCYRINLFTYAAKSRPWNCKLEINIFTPDSLLEKLAHINIFSMNIFEDKFRPNPSHNALDITILVDIENYT